MRKGKDPDLDPDPYLWLMDPNYGSGRLKNIRIPNTASNECLRKVSQF